jgi:hypothetical protein
LLACLEGTLLLLSDKHSEEENRIDPLGEVPVELVVVMSSDVFRSPDNYGDARRPTARPVAPTCRRQPDHSRRDPSPERHSSLLVSAPVMTERACPFFFFFFWHPLAPGTSASALIAQSRRRQPEGTKPPLDNLGISPPHSSCLKDVEIVEGQSGLLPCPTSWPEGCARDSFHFFR